MLGNAVPRAAFIKTTIDLGYAVRELYQDLYDKK
jgi:hypothetical protein